MTAPTYNQTLLASGQAKADKARALLMSHRARLQKVIDDNEFACTVRSAKSLLDDVNRWLAQPPLAMALALGEWGPNAKGRRVDAVEKESEQQRRINERGLPFLSAPDLAFAMAEPADVLAGYVSRARARERKVAA